MLRCFDGMTFQMGILGLEPGSDVGMSTFLSKDAKLEFLG